MGSKEFLDALATCRKVNVDTSAFIYHLQRTTRYRPLMEDLFRMAAEQHLEVVISAVVQLELLIQPMRRQAPDEVETVLELTEQYPNITVIDVSRPVVLAAAAIRGQTRLKVPDAVVLATGVVEGCDATIGNDADCRKATLALGKLRVITQDISLTLPAYLQLDDFTAVA